MIGFCSSFRKHCDANISQFSFKGKIGENYFQLLQKLNIMIIYFFQSWQVNYNFF